MKKSILCLLLLLAVLLTACASAKGPDHTVMSDGTGLIIDRDAGTISDGQHTYRYKLSGNTKKYTVTVTYPNGATYNEHVNDGVGTSDWSGDYDETGYLSGKTLVSSVIGQLPQPKNTNIVLAGVLVLIIGLFLAIFPRKAWHLTNGWQYQSTEPSDAVLKMGRIAGIAMVIAGAVLLIV